MGALTDAEYLQRFEDWTERYAKSVSPSELVEFPEPMVGNPRIVERNGYRASVLYLKNFALSKCISKLIDHPKPRVLEIGAGFGGMAEILMRTRPIESYTVVDLPEVLPLSEFYLRSTHPEKALEFVDCNEIEKVQKDFDVVINTMSFGEMPKETAQAYVKWAMKKSPVLISHNSVQRTPSGVNRHSEYGFHNYRIDKINSMPEVAGAFHAQHLVVVVKRGEPNVSAERLDRLQEYVSLGLHEDLDRHNEKAMEAMLVAVKSGFFGRGKHLREYLSCGESMLARAYAQCLLGGPIEAPNYIRRELEKGGKRAVKRIIRKALQPA